MEELSADKLLELKTHQHLSKIDYIVDHLLGQAVAANFICDAVMVGTMVDLRGKLISQLMTLQKSTNEPPKETGPYGPGPTLGYMSEYP